MKVRLSFGQMVGSIVKASMVGIMSVCVGPEAAISTAMVENIADAAGEAISGIHIKQDLREKIRQMMRESLEEAFVQVEKPQVNSPSANDTPEDETIPVVAEEQQQDLYGVVSPKVQAFLYNLLFHEKELSLEMNDSLVTTDGKQLFHSLVMEACMEYADEVDIETFPFERLERCFFGNLQSKMMEDGLTSNLLIYRTILGLVPIVERLPAQFSQTLDSRMQSLKNDIQFRIDEGIPVSGVSTEDEFDWQKLTDIIEEIMNRKSITDDADTERMGVAENVIDNGTPKYLTTIPGVRKFVGRTQELGDLSRNLEEMSKDPSGEKSLVIWADGGMGKTALAKMLLKTFQQGKRENKEDYFSHFAWINYSGDLSQDLAALGVGGAGSTLRQAEKFRQVQAWLRNTEEKTLIVIDNYDMPVSDADFDQIGMFSDEVYVLMTSRIEQEGYFCYELDKPSVDDAERIFYNSYEVTPCQEGIPETFPP